MRNGYLNQGLEDVPVAETRLSKINGGLGELVIGGFPVDELAANATYPESVFLLLNGRLPTENELDEFTRDLARRRTIGDDVRELLRRAAEENRTGMDALRIGAAAANLGTDEGDEQTNARRIIAVFPTVVAAYWRYRMGKEPVAPDEELLSWIVKHINV